jgi:hypothetical protein
MDKKHFTVEEANALIPDLEELLDELDSRWEKLQDLNELLAAAQRGNGGQEGVREFQENQEVLGEGFQRMQAMGIHLKDVREGLVDFLHLREGREVYLCWKRGESEIEYWHELETGFAGRQPL